nr:MAG TPA: hypothetical protein [Caudoviricetes sp.]
MKAYKGFNKDMTCTPKGGKPFQYKEGETYEEPEAYLCKRGFHACLDPLDCLNYYDICNGVYHEVELDDVFEEHHPEDTKVCGRKIKIGAKLSIKDIVKSSVDFTMERVKKEGGTNSGDYANLASSGDYANLASSGDYANLASSGDNANLASSGYYANLASSGDYANLASSGNNAKLASSGYYAKLASSGDNANLASSGYYAKLASSGDYAKLASSGNNANLASSGDYANLASSGDNANLASSGDYANLASSGDYAKLASSGNNNVVMSAGIDGKVKAAIGNWIAIAEWQIRGGHFVPVGIVSAQVDGEKVKADTWYKCENGQLMEAEEE